MRMKTEPNQVPMVFARGCINARPGKDGRLHYQFRVDLPPDPKTGKRRQKSYTYDTMEEAEQGRRVFQEELRHQHIDARVAAEAVKMFDDALRTANRGGRRPTARKISKARDSVLRKLVASWDWKPGNEGENRIIKALHGLAVSRDSIEQQFTLGPYTIDFAWVRERLALEADGWVHQHERMRVRDAERDAQMDRWGWQVYRVNTEQDDDDLAAEVAKIVRQIE